LAGATRRKAVAFYLHAAEYAKLPLSKFFKTPRIGAAARADIPTRRRKREPLEERGSPSEAQPSAADMKQRYLDLLMKRVESEEQLDEKLLDRIEALLGYQKPE
jgi:hypothetical protein